MGGPNDESVFKAVLGNEELSTWQDTRYKPFTREIFKQNNVTFGKKHCFENRHPTDKIDCRTIIAVHRTTPGEMDYLQQKIQALESGKLQNLYMYEG